MRRFLLLPTLFVSLAVLTAQPPTKVDKESREDIYTDDYPSAASARGSAIGTRDYAPTPSMREEMRESNEIAGQPATSRFRYAITADGAGAYLENDAHEFDDDDRLVSSNLIDTEGRVSGNLRYSYGTNGELVRIDRYESGRFDPIQSFGYRYTPNNTVIEEQIMPDGSFRFVREVGIDEFQAVQGPGNQPYRDNRPTNQHITVPNEPTGTVTMPSVGDEPN